MESLLTQQDVDLILFVEFWSFPPVFNVADQWNKEHASRNDSRSGNRPTFYFRHVSSRRPHALCRLCVHMSTELPHPIFLIRKQTLSRLYLRRTGANRRDFPLTGDTCPGINDHDKPPPQRWKFISTYEIQGRSAITISPWIRHLHLHSCWT